MNKRFEFMFLQRGTLPLGPDRRFTLSLEHRCSSVLIWPEGEHPTSENTILLDPCFTSQGFQSARKQLAKRALTFTDIGSLFVTHRHIDHLPNFPHHKEFSYFQIGSNPRLSAITTVPCPGHSRDLQSLIFRSVADEQVWAVGDAVLNLKWLKAWEYYWPNFYTPREVVQTWKSVANILLHADVIIPGHGGLIYVTASLVEELLSTFPSAKHAKECPDVERLLSNRLAQLQAQTQRHDAKETR